jgi:hypothetical protein
MFVTKRKDVNGLHYDTTALNTEIPSRYAYENLIIHLNAFTSVQRVLAKNINLKTES